MGFEIGATYELTGPDGTKAIFNGSTAAADFAGYLNIEDGISGLDGAEVREQKVEIVEGHGVRHGDFFRGARPVTIHGFLPPQKFSTMTLVNQALDRIARAAAALVTPSTLEWTEQGRAKTIIWLRQTGPPRWSQRNPKEFLLAFESEWPYVSEYTLNTLTDSAAPLSVAPGNLGSAPAYPKVVLRNTSGSGIAGPHTITFSTGAGTTGYIKTKASYTLPTGKQLVIVTDPLGPSIKETNAGDEAAGVLVKGSAIDFATTTWPPLLPGSNTVASDKGSRLDVDWRSAWL